MITKNKRVDKCIPLVLHLFNKLIEALLSTKINTRQSWTMLVIWSG
jgi:hypothetical protein